MQQLKNRSLVLWLGITTKHKMQNAPQHGMIFTPSDLDDLATFHFHQLTEVLLQEAGVGAPLQQAKKVHWKTKTNSCKFILPVVLQCEEIQRQREMTVKVVFEFNVLGWVICIRHTNQFVTFTNMVSVILLDPSLESRKMNSRTRGWVMMWLITLGGKLVQTTFGRISKSEALKMHSCRFVKTSCMPALWTSVWSFPEDKRHLSIKGAERQSSWETSVSLEANFTNC